MEKLAGSAKKWDWKTWAIIGLGGVAAIAAGAFVMQSKYSALGRQVHRNVTKFLVDNGARIEGGVISGGMVSIPMKTNIAVNSTVVSLLNTFSDQLGGRPPLNPSVSSDEPVITGRHSPSSQRPQHEEQGTPPSGAQAESGIAQGPSPRGSRRSSMSGPVRNPTDSPDDGGFKAREGQKGGDFSYNPMEFAPKGSRPPQDVNIFEDEAPSSAGGDFE